MEINKRLNLNKNPQHADNYSMCFAKNIKLSDDSTTIITDNGFKLSFSTGEVEGNIVGIIPCSTEIVIFTYNENATYQALYIIYPELWSGLSNGGYIDIGGIKIEKGNKPTEWTPAPQDLVTVDTTNNTLVFFQ